MAPLAAVVIAITIAILCGEFVAALSLVWTVVWLDAPGASRSPRVSAARRMSVRGLLLYHILPQRHCGAPRYGLRTLARLRASAMRRNDGSLPVARLGDVAHAILLKAARALFLAPQRHMQRSGGGVRPDRRRSDENSNLEEREKDRRALAGPTHPDWVTYPVWR